MAHITWRTIRRLLSSVIQPPSHSEPLLLRAVVSGHGGQPRCRTTSAQTHSGRRTLEASVSELHRRRRHISSPFQRDPKDLGRAPNTSLSRSKLQHVLSAVLGSSCSFQGLECVLSRFSLVQLFATPMGSEVPKRGIGDQFRPSLKHLPLRAASEHHFSSDPARLAAACGS